MSGKRSRPRDGERPRWAHLAGNNPYVIARQQAAMDQRAAERDYPTGEIPIIRLDESGRPDADTQQRLAEVGLAVGPGWDDSDAAERFDPADRTTPAGLPDPVDPAHAASPVADAPDRWAAAVAERTSAAPVELDEWVVEAQTDAARAAAGDGAPAAGITDDPARESRPAPRQRSLVGSSAAVGIGTALSRITGMIKTVALAYALGQTLLSDAYNLANTAPNMVYDLILGGILSATLVPVFVERFERGDRQGVYAVMSVAFAGLLALTAAAMVLAPWLFRVYTWLEDGDAEALSSAGVPLLRFFLPQILFYGLIAVVEALLNARRRFGAPAFVPILNNIVVSTVLVVFAQRAGRAPTIEAVLDDQLLLWLLGAGTTFGIVVMGLALWPTYRRAEIGFRWNFDLRNPAVRKVMSLSGWTFGYVLANQIALTICFALVTRERAVSTYSYAFQFFQLPYGLFAVSLMTTFTPAMASAVARGDRTEFRDRLSEGIRLMSLVVLPSAVGLAVLGRPVVQAFLGHGSFTAADADLTGDLLACFMVGLASFSVFLFALRGFYARHDTRTPFFINLGKNVINVALAFALVGRFGAQGVALSYALAYVIGSVVALAMLRRRAGDIDARRIVASMAKMVVAAGIMGVAVYVASRSVASPTGTGALVRVGVGIVAGGVTYLVAVLVLRVEEVRPLLHRFRALSSRG